MKLEVLLYHGIYGITSALSLHQSVLCVARESEEMPPVTVTVVTLGTTYY